MAVPTQQAEHLVQEVFDQEAHPAQGHTCLPPRNTLDEDMPCISAASP